MPFVRQKFDFYGVQFGRQSMTNAMWNINEQSLQTKSIVPQTVHEDQTLSE